MSFLDKNCVRMICSGGTAKKLAILSFSEKVISEGQSALILLTTPGFSLVNFSNASSTLFSEVDPVPYISSGTFSPVHRSAIRSAGLNRGPVFDSVALLRSSSQPPVFSRCRPRKAISLIHESLMLLKCLAIICTDWDMRASAGSMTEIYRSPTFALIDRLK